MSFRGRNRDFFADCGDQVQQNRRLESPYDELSSQDDHSEFSQTDDGKQVAIFNIPGHLADDLLELLLQKICSENFGDVLRLNAKQDNRVMNHRFAYATFDSTQTAVMVVDKINTAQLPFIGTSTGRMKSRIHIPSKKRREPIRNNFDTIFVKIFKPTIKLPCFTAIEITEGHSDMVDTLQLDRLMPLSPKAGSVCIFLQTDDGEVSPKIAIVKKASSDSFGFSEIEIIETGKEIKAFNKLLFSPPLTSRVFCCKLNDPVEEHNQKLVEEILYKYLGENHPTELHCHLRVLRTDDFVHVNIHKNPGALMGFTELMKELNLIHVTNEIPQIQNLHVQLPPLTTSSNFPPLPASPNFLPPVQKPSQNFFISKDGPICFTKPPQNPNAGPVYSIILPERETIQCAKVTNVDWPIFHIQLQTPKVYELASMENCLNVKIDHMRPVGRVNQGSLVSAIVNSKVFRAVYLDEALPKGHRVYLVDSGKIVYADVVSLNRPPEFWIVPSMATPCYAHLSVDMTEDEMKTILEYAALAGVPIHIKPTNVPTHPPQLREVATTLGAETHKNLKHSFISTLELPHITL